LSTLPPVGSGPEPETSAAFSKSGRLLNAADYKNVFDRSVRSSDKFFTVLAKPNNRCHPRLGMAFTKKRVRLAVQRNRLKRITRESFRTALNLYHADYVVLAGQDWHRADNRQLFHSLTNHWRRLKEKCENF
jgi:ribonuclease P protein component